MCWLSMMVFNNVKFAHIFSFFSCQFVIHNFTQFLIQFFNRLFADFPAQFSLYLFNHSFVHRLYSHVCAEIFAYFPRCVPRQCVILNIIYYVTHFEFIVWVNCIHDFPFMFACNFPCKFAIDFSLKFSLNCWSKDQINSARILQFNFILQHESCFQCICCLSVHSICRSFLIIFPFIFSYMFSQM